MTGTAGSAAPGTPRDDWDVRRAAHFQALVESSEDAILSKDAQGLITSWNGAAERLYGWGAEEAIGESIALIIPPDHANEEKEILARILAGEQIAHYETERVRKDGRRVSVSLTVSPIRAEGEIVGASVVARDITERIKREERAARLQEITAALARQADAGPAIGVLVRDGAEALEADAATLGMLAEDGREIVLADDVGHSSEGLAGWQRFPLDAELPMCEAIRDLKPIWSSTAEDVRQRFPILADAKFRFAALAVLPLVVEGRALGAVSFSFREPRVFGAEDRAFATSIVQQVANAIERGRIYDAQRSVRQRLSFLARASEMLSESLEPRETLTRLANLTVRHICDWCSVDLDDTYTEIDPIIAHIDRSKVEQAEEFRRRYPPDPDAPSGVPQVIRSGEPEIYPEVTEQMLADAATDEEHLEMMRQLDIRSAMIVPLEARGRVLGAITFVACGERTFGPDDLELAEDLARRAALAVDTSMLYQREHETALTLQRALLPASPPSVEGVEIATRYLPAEAGLEVGGDWYDVIETTPGRVDVVIGDVAGRGVHAAAVMGRLALSLRAYLLDGRPIEAAVAGLDQLMRGLDAAQMSTLLALSLDLGGGAARYVRAGHPPGLLRRPDRTIVELEGEVSPPVGILDGASFRVNEAELAPGAMLLLYTDGLIERRRLDLRIGIARLKEAFAAASDDPGAVVEELPTALDAERVPDDIALLALRYSGTGAAR
jgi:PAS domain S-box-containing protein